VWRNDFEAARLRDGNLRYGNEFAVMMNLLVQCTSEPASDDAISGPDIIAIGHVSCAAARNCLMYITDGTSSRHMFHFRAALSTFFRALSLCDNSSASLEILKDAAAR
jgi:hypothetical protein